jgi:competence protein ComFC
MSLWGELKGFINEIIYFIFPPTCPGCGKIDTFLCTKCEQELHPTPFEIAPKIIASLPYKNEVVKRALWLLKYRNQRRIASLFGRVLFETIFENLSEKKDFVNIKNYVIVAVPMSDKRTRERGYNHALLIANSLKEFIGSGIAVLPNALQKVRETKNQAKTKNKSERLTNVKDSMRAKRELVVGKHVILIDDVTTTGATLKEATRALKESGAKSVHSYVVAH